MNHRQVCVITGSRAEFGLLRLVLEQIRADPRLSLSLIATGSHLSREAGFTSTEILDAGFNINRAVDIDLSSDDPVGIARSMGLAIEGCARAIQDLNPDLVVVLGDRFEIFAAATAALVSRTPIVHIHGGEVTHGSMDDQFRHAITKLASIHCVSSEIHRRRVLQMGEDPSSVHVVGGLGVEAVQTVKLMSRAEVEETLRFSLAKENFMLTFHPETATTDFGYKALRMTLAALDRFPESTVIASLPNADSGGRRLRELLTQFGEERPRFLTVESLGQRLYFSCLALSRAVIGNSSSGLLEAPALGVGTVNVGERQGGRDRPRSVIDVSPSEDAIYDAVTRTMTPEYRNVLKAVSEGLSRSQASRKIVAILKQIDPASLGAKKFVDVE